MIETPGLSNKIICGSPAWQLLVAADDVSNATMAFALGNDRFWVPPWRCWLVGISGCLVELNSVSGEGNIFFTPFINDADPGSAYDSPIIANDDTATTRAFYKSYPRLLQVERGDRLEVRYSTDVDWNGASKQACFLWLAMAPEFTAEQNS